MQRESPVSPLELEILKRLLPEKLKARGLEPPKAPPCIHQRSFIRFLYDCIWTIDEGRAGEVRPWPQGGDWDDYWSDWETALLCATPLFVDKTRRTMASNVVAAWDLWVLAGGQDPRWPALMLSTDNRRVLIQSQMREGPGGSEEFLERIGTFYRLAVENGLRKRWPGFPTFEFYSREAKGSNGAVAQAVAQGADKVRGPGTTLLHMEELSVWEQAQDSCEAAIPALNPYGHLVAVATPRVDSYASRIRRGEFKMYGGIGGRPPTKRLPLFLAGDWAILEIRGTRDVPGYDASAFRGMSVQKHRAEVLGDWTASGGKIVFAEYGDIHEPKEPLPFDPSRPLVLGWDLPAATGGTKCCVPTQLSAAGQWCIFAPIVESKDEAIGMWEFGERVAQEIYEEFAAPYDLELNDLELIHYGDPAGNAKPLMGGEPSKRGEIRSAYEVLLLGDDVPLGHDAYGKTIVEKRPGRGWRIQPGEKETGKRLEAVRGRLTTLLSGGAPALVVDVGAGMIREAFRGGYHYHQRPDGRYDLDPAKNKYAEPMDCISYAATRLFAARGRRDRDEDERPRRAAVRAPGRPRQ